MRDLDIYSVVCEQIRHTRYASEYTVFTLTYLRIPQCDKWVAYEQIAEVTIQ